MGKIIQTMDKSMNQHPSSSFIEDSFMLEFMEMMQRNVAELIKESCQVACAVYQMHIIGKMTAKEIAEELN